MTAQMSYAMLKSEALQIYAESIRQLLGSDPLCAWLEDPLDEGGLRLRENVDPRQVALHAGGVQLPEDANPAGGPAIQRRWPQGRLFNQRIDLQWEGMRDYLHLAAISEAALPAPFEGHVPLEAIDAEPRFLLLWGRHDPQKGWIEGRIPSLAGIYPPAWNGPHAAIAARAYEATWSYDPHDPTALPSARVVTRYLGYDGNYNPPQDPRF